MLKIHGILKSTKFNAAHQAHILSTTARCEPRAPEAFTDERILHVMLLPKITNPMTVEMFKIDSLRVPTETTTKTIAK